MGGRLHGLEAVRGAAAFLVAWYHVGFLSGGRESASILFDEAYLAVDLFFLLSGFVLARTYEGKMPSAMVFTRLRIARLWMPIAVGVGVGAIYFALRDVPLGYFLVQLVAGLLILPVIGWRFAFNPPAWSILFEVIANALHAALLQRLSVVALVGLSFLSGGVLWAYLPSHGLDVSGGDDIWLCLPRTLMSYCLGIVIYRVNGDRSWMPASAAWLPIALYAGALAFYPSELEGAPEILFVLLVHPMVLLGTLAMPRSSVALLLGSYSFPLYALHYPLQMLGLYSGFSWWQALAISLAGAAVIGLAIDRHWRRRVAEIVVPVGGLRKAST